MIIIKNRKEKVEEKSNDMKKKSKEKIFERAQIIKMCLKKKAEDKK